MPEPFKEVKYEEFDLACIIRLCPKEFLVSTIMSSENGSASFFQPGLLGEVPGHWTIELCFMIAHAK